MNRIVASTIIAFALSTNANATYFSRYWSFNTKTVSGPATTCDYELTPDPDQAGQARITLTSDRKIKIVLRGAAPDTLYTVWTDHRNRNSGDLAADYPIGKLAEPRGVAPTFATTAAITNGMGLDPNSIMTDRYGNATWETQLDYDLLATSASPVVAAGLAKRGGNVYGGSWLRVHAKDASKGPSLQLVDQSTGLPKLFRSTAQGITIVRHPIKISHGHSPGLADLDHFPAYADDFPATCRQSGHDD